MFVTSAGETLILNNDVRDHVTMGHAVVIGRSAWRASSTFGCLSMGRNEAGPPLKQG